MATTKRKKRPRSRSLRGLTSVSAGTAAAERFDNLKVEAFKIGLLAAGGGLLFGGILLAKNTIKRQREERNQEDVKQQILLSTATPSAASYADRLRIAFNPSGFEYLRSMDTTDVTGVMNVARAIPTQAVYVQVAKLYKQLTRRFLSDDLADELSAQEYQQFRALLLKKPAK